MKRIKGFDGLRALAVLAVFIYHKTPNFSGAMGHFGVELFFALSGFLIIKILHANRLSIESGRQEFWPALKDFLFRRSLRIFPIYYLLLIVLALLAASGFYTVDWNPIGHLFHAFYLSNYWIGSVQQEWPGSYSHLWSLSIEEQFYLIIAPLLLIFPSSSHLRICLGIVAVGMLVLVSDILLGARNISVLNNSFINFSSIAMGGIAGIFLSERKMGPRLERYTLVPFIVFFLCWCGLFFAGGLTRVIVYQSVPVVAVFIVISVALSQSGRIVSALEWRPLVGMGKVSYGFYLYHNFINLKLFHGHNLALNLLNHLAEFAVALVISCLSWSCIERPLIAYGARRTARFNTPSLVTG